MSIAPPSDIIMDVAQAADPLKLQAANLKLARAAAAAGGPAFDATLDAAAGRTAATRPPLPGLLPAGVQRTSIEPKRAATDQKFEAMVLQSFIENVLPKDSDLFGDKASADMGRSLLAEQIAKQLAKSGRIGIAQSLERSHAASAAPIPLKPLVPRA